MYSVLVRYAAGGEGITYSWSKDTDQIVAAQMKRISGGVLKYSAVAGTHSDKKFSLLLGGMDNSKVKTKVRDPLNLIPGIDIRCFA